MHNIEDFSLNLFSLKGKNAIVTGGNSGLGQGLRNIIWLLLYRKPAGWD